MKTTYYKKYLRDNGVPDRIVRKIQFKFFPVIRFTLYNSTEIQKCIIVIDNCQSNSFSSHEEIINYLDGYFSEYILNHKRSSTLKDILN